MKWWTNLIFHIKRNIDEIYKIVMNNKLSFYNGYKQFRKIDANTQ